MLSKSINGRICYQDSCPQCEIDLGFRPKSRLGMLCITCGHSKAKKDKPSPKKGIKTGKPAWNRGLNFDNKVKKMLSARMSRRMRHALSGRNLSKGWVHIFDMLGYTVEQLEQHLKSKFEPGMTWENHGIWHIDHIIPLSSAKTIENMYKLCYYTNLQPLWAHENFSKGNKI